MKGNPKVLEVLGEALIAELTAIDQYFVHAEMCENWGYDALYHVTRERVITEMKHAEKIIDRILYLEGKPDMSRQLGLHIGDVVDKMLAYDLDAEKDAITRYNRGIAVAREVGDNGTRELLEDNLEDEESHANTLEAHLTQIQQIGLDNYLANQVGK
ncbi:MAG: bacterioferritin [Chloroflexi bacterium]|nr:bacterioferritin [Chloroflexota bacterium]